MKSLLAVPDSGALAPDIIRQDSQDCILWDGPTNGRGGYPVVWLNGRKRLVTHLVWEEETGNPVPSGIFICHRCDTPACIAIDHLFAGTPADNSRDMIAKGRGRGHFPKRDVCKRGHSLLAVDNTIVQPDGRRNCRECSRKHCADYRNRRRADPATNAAWLEAHRIRQRKRVASETPGRREERLANQRSYGKARRRAWVAEDPERYAAESEQSRVRSKAQHARLREHEPEKYEARLARQRELAAARYAAKRSTVAQ